MNILDKFNVIYPIDDNNDFKEIIKSYLENYLENNDSIFLSEYIYQLIWFNKICSNDLINIYCLTMNKYIINIKQNIQLLYKKRSFTLTKLNNILNDINQKHIRITNIFNITLDKYLYIDKLLTHPIIINFIESQLYNLNDDILIIIKHILDNINTISNLSYINFLKIIGSCLTKQIITINNIYIPSKYKNLYELKNINHHITILYDKFKFTSTNIIYIITPFYNSFIDKLGDTIIFCSIDELLNLLNYNFFNDLIIPEDFKLSFKKEISAKLLYFINLELNIDTIYKILKLIIKCNYLQILESFVIVDLQKKNITAYIIKLIHNYIISDFEYIIDILKLNIITTKNIKDTDIITYQQNLIIRLLSQNFDIMKEKHILLELNKILNSKYTHKITKIINDVITSNNLNNKSNEFNTLIVSYDVWDLNNQQTTIFNNSDIISSNTDYYIFNNNFEKKFELDESTLTNYLNKFSHYYSEIHSNKKKILWFLHYGQINVTFNNHEIILLPIQLLVLELFENTNTINYNEIIEIYFFKTYSIDFIENIIKSLIIGGILKKINNTITLITEISNINYIDIFNNINNFNMPFNNIQIELAHNREDILKCQINHFVKKNNNIHKNELYILLLNNITLFTINDELYNNVLEKMIKLDYIKINNDIVHKLY